MTLIFGFVYNNFLYVFLVPIFCVIYSFNFTKFLKIDIQTISYKDFKILSNLGKGIKYKYIYNDITIRVVKIGYYQNIVEKFLNVGHIEFTDDNENEHTIYGITHFNVRKQEIENSLKKE